MKKHYTNPWITEPIRKLIKAKCQYFQLYRLSLASIEENKIFRNKVNSMIRKHKAKFYADLFENSKSDLRNTWKIINNLISKTKKTKEITRIICSNITYTILHRIISIVCVTSDISSKYPKPTRMIHCSVLRRKLSL